MDVILFETVKNLGRQGDVVKVSEGYYRNFLKPKGLAEEANAASMKRFEKMKKKVMELHAQQVSEAKDLAKRLEGTTVTVKAKAGESDKLFGSVTQHDIADALAVAGYQVDKKQIEMDEHIKKLGEHTVTIRIHPDVTGKVKVMVAKI